MTHLDPSQIIEFVRGRGDESARAEIEDHIDECDECRERIADAVRHARGEVEQADTNVDDLSGTTIGRYKIGERLGSGGMGVVYVAEDVRLHRRVVIKLLRPELERAGNFERFRARLLREAQAMAQLSHPNVVQVYDLGAFDNSVYVAMEYVDGGDLREWLAEKPRATSEILHLFLQAAHGLAAAHEIGIVHRDFKPANVVVGANGRAKVADFGLARPMRDSQPEQSGDTSEDMVWSPEVQGRPAHPMLSAITQAGALVGTPAYMAPEQAASEQVDARADQYSFCLALYQAIERVKPSAIVDATGALRPPDLIPRRIWLAIRRGLSRRPADRFPSMNALIDALTPRSNLVRNSAIALGLASIATASTWWYVRGPAACHVPTLTAPAFMPADYATRWNEMYASTCSDPPLLAQRRQLCLKTRGKIFDSLLPCSSESTLFLEPVSPAADAVPKILALRERLLRREDPAAIVRDAESLGYAPLMAEAYLHAASYTQAIQTALDGNAVEIRARALSAIGWTSPAAAANARIEPTVLPRSECLIDDPAARVYMPLDGDARDERGHTSTILGGASSWIDGHRRGGLDFDGHNDSIDLGAGPDLDNLTALTACAWVRPRNYRSNYPAILDKSHDNFVGGWNFYIQTDGTFGLLTPYREYALGGHVRLREWHHVCATWNGKRGYDSIALYVDAVQIAHQDTGTNEKDDDVTLLPDDRDSDAKNKLLVGRSNDGKHPFDGVIDEVRVWARAASWREIMQIYDCSFSP